MIHQRRIHEWRRVHMRAFTLIEVVITVIVLAIAVPPTLNLMDSASAGRVDAINTTRATFLSTIVLESVMADMTSRQKTLGFGALINSNVYLTNPTTGLYARIAQFTNPYTQVGLSYSVVISGLVSSSGTPSSKSNENVFRIVTVQVQLNSASGTQLMMPVSLLVSKM